MKELDDAAHEPQSRERRTLLAALLAGYAASYIPWTFAQTGNDTAGTAYGAFMSVSKILTGRDKLDATHATRLYHELAADDPRFATAVQALLALIRERKIDPLHLQPMLDGEKSPLAALPNKIVTGWYTGIVGNGDAARIIAYETALNAVIVADVLQPPTYCYGVYGSWAKKPA